MVPSAFGCYDINVSTQPTVRPGKPREVRWVLEEDRQLQLQPSAAISLLHRAVFVQ